MAEPYYERAELTRDDLENDQQFLNDLYLYMQQRTGRRIGDKDERIDEFMELFRQSQVNEVTALKNLTHVRKANDKGKALMGKMFLAYDKSTGATGFLDKIWDYGSGLISSPATVGSLALALPTLGGSLAARGVLQTGVRATNELVKQTITRGVKSFVNKQMLRGAATAGAIEAPVEGLIMGTEAAARRETGREEFEDIDVLEQTAMGVGFGALGGAVGGGIAGRLSGKRAFKGQERLNRMFDRKETNIKAGEARAEKYLSTLSPAQRKKEEELIDKTYKELLKPLHPFHVQRGREILQTRIPWDVKIREAGKSVSAVPQGVTRDIHQPFQAGVNPRIMKNATTAALEIIRLSGKSADEKGLRITEILSEALARAAEVEDTARTMTVSPTGTVTFKLAPEEKLKLELSEILGILKDYNLSPREFSQVYMAEVSEAARLLVNQRWAKAAFLKQSDEAIEAKNKIMDTTKSLKNMIEKSQEQMLRGDHRAAGLADVPDEVMKSLDVFSKMAGGAYNSLDNVWTVTKNLDKARLGMMTIQPATTIRNTVNGTARLAIFSLDNLFQGSYMQFGTLETRREGRQRMLAGPRLLKSLLDPTEAEIVKTLFAEEMPSSFLKLFRKAADIEASLGTGSKLVSISRWFNSVNTLSDNIFKRAIFMSELQNIVGRKKLLKYMDEGRFSDIPEEQISEAMQEALSFSYQRGFNKYKSDSRFEGLGQWFIGAFAKPGASFAIPFPRFTANSLEFMYKHAPIIGLMDFPALLARRAGEAKLIGRGAGKIIDLKNLPAGMTTDAAKAQNKAVKLARGKAERAKKALPKRVGQQTTGLGMLYGAIQLRAQQGPDANWWELYDEDTGEYKNAFAFYGPFAPYMLVADIIVRAGLGETFVLGQDEVKQKWENSIKSDITLRMLESDTWIDFAKGAFGPQFKTGVGKEFLSGLREGVEEWLLLRKTLDPKNPEYAKQLDNANYRFNDHFAGFAGNLVSTLFVPMGAVRDVMAAFDPKEYEGMKSTDSISPINTFWNKSLRSFPVSSDGKYFNIVSSGDLSRFVGGEGEAVKSTISPTVTTTEEEKKREQGIYRQFTGLGSPVRRNELQKELLRLGLKEYKLFTTIPQDDELTRILREHYQKIVENEIMPVILKSEYKNRTPEDRKDKLEKLIRDKTGSALDTVYSILRGRFNRAGKDDVKIREDAIEKMTKILQIRFKEFKDWPRLQSIKSFKAEFGKPPNFSSQRDMIRLLDYAKQVAKSKI